MPPVQFWKLLSVHYIMMYLVKQVLIVNSQQEFYRMQRAVSVFCSKTIANIMVKSIQPLLKKIFWLEQHWYDLTQSSSTVSLVLFPSWLSMHVNE